MQAVKAMGEERSLVIPNEQATPGRTLRCGDRSIADS
jgi:hypothetical protein